MPRERLVKTPDPRLDAVEARALWYVAPGAAELRTDTHPLPAAGDVQVRTLFSGLSRGTERLVFEGRVPKSEWERMRAPAQAGDFPFPVKYGYAAVGEIEAGPQPLLKKQVFALYPHQDRFVVPADDVVAIPAGVPARRAVLTANLETALNILWDGNAAPGDHIVIVGSGVVGLLVAALAARLPGAEVTAVDVDSSRAAIAEKFGFAFAEPKRAPHGADLVIHTSASEAGLSLAFECAGDEATIVEASWHGENACEVSLGGAFHSRRLKLISSQVGNIACTRRPRWTRRRRLQTAAQLLADERLDALLGEEVPFAELPRHLPRLFARDAAGIGALVRY
ncbi:MAG TPA: zinc-binding alcohol dehydrogenase [Xanthobacteraceae bacterium]|nr:zinc-binding alcohol dehydrogenase [Xanthobacteraceae bacterium]